MKNVVGDDICRNLPSSEKWRGSFYERLSEYGEWDSHEFWILHLDLISTAKALSQERAIDKQLACSVVLLKTKIDNLYAAHFNSFDVFKIVNLDVEDLLAFKERFDLAILGIFSGEVFPEERFELMNPFLQKDS